MQSYNEHNQRIDRLDKGRPRKTVTILGAGMAGLTAAYELECRGHTVRILEGSDRVGGRVRTHTFSDGTYGELGAMRIPFHHDYTKCYCAMLKLTLRPFISSHQNLNCFYDIRDIANLRMKDAPARLYPLFPLSGAQQGDVKAPDMFGRTMGGVFSNLLDSEIMSLLTPHLQTDRLRELDRTTLGEFLRVRAGDGAAEIIGLTTGLEQFFDMAITDFMRESVGEDPAHPGELLEISGGMERLPQELLKKIKTPVQFNTEIRGIHARSDGKVDLSLSRDGAPSRETCDHVICTLPFTVLRKVEIRPALGNGKMQAIRQMNYASASKVLLHCTQRFWETNYCIAGGASQTDQLNRAVYYPSDNVTQVTPVSAKKFATIFSNQPVAGFKPNDANVSSGPGVLLGAYNWGKDARVLGSLSEAARRDVVVRSISRFHPEIANAGMVDDSKSVFWDASPWMNGGTFSFLHPGQHESLYQHAIEPESNIHFAGEHCSLYSAWIQGAIESACRTVEEVVSL